MKNRASIIIMLFMLSGCCSNISNTKKNKVTPPLTKKAVCSYKSDPKTESAKKIIHRTKKQLGAIERGECD